MTTLAAVHADGVDEVVDLDGALVTPAFVDAHAHLSQTGAALRGVDVSGAPSLAVAISRVEDAARAQQGRPLYAPTGTSGAGRSAAASPQRSSTAPPTAASSTCPGWTGTPR